VQPKGFFIPSNFPYRAGFRGGFNVTRVGVDFGTPLLEANWFLLGSNCTRVVPSATGVMPSGTGVLPSGTGVVLSGTAGVFPSKTGSRGPTATAGIHGKKGMFKRSGLRLRV